MTNYLLVYNRRTGDLELEEFHGAGGRKRALASRIEREAHRIDRDLEIVVLSSDSLEELRRTHGRYFASAGDMAREAVRDNLGGFAAV